MMPSVLMVEDDDDFALLVRRAFVKIQVPAAISQAKDGEEAIAYLRSTDGPRLSLVLLDLMLPKCSGFEVLRWARSSPPVSKLPIIILTSSGEDYDRAPANGLGADDYRVKPAGFSDLVALIRQITTRWLPSR